MPSSSGDASDGFEVDEGALRSADEAGSSADDRECGSGGSDVDELGSVVEDDERPEESSDGAPGDADEDDEVDGGSELRVASAEPGRFESPDSEGVAPSESAPVRVADLGLNWNLLPPQSGQPESISFEPSANTRSQLVHW